MPHALDDSRLGIAMLITLEIAAAYGYLTALAIVRQAFERSCDV